MTRIGRLTLAVAVPLLALATAAQAQLAGIPVYFNPRGGTGIGVAANLGFPNSDARGGTAYGVAGSFGTGPMTLTAMVGAYKGKDYGSAETSYGASASFRVFGGGFLPVAVAAQVGYGSVKSPLDSATVSTIPVGVGISFDPPLFPLKPWIAPRIDFTSGGAGGSTSSFHVSGGVNFNLLLGLGLHAAVDWGQMKVTTASGTVTKSPLILGVGAHFNFHVPMM